MESPASRFDPRVALVLESFCLSLTSVHGPAHWARVMENGLHLAPLTGADPVVVSLFAIFHDSCRQNDGTDVHHGPRAAKWLRTLDLGLTGQQRELVVEACAGHTNSLLSPDPTIGTCWDADRLDIGRVGVIVDPKYMSTRAARDPDIIGWAQRRAHQGFVPDYAQTLL